MAQDEAQAVAANADPSKPLRLAHRTADVEDVATATATPLASALRFVQNVLPSGPIAIAAAKVAVQGGLDAPLFATALHTEASSYATTVPTQDRIEGLQAFKEKRAPVYRGV